jgi:hypothetical protein
LLLFYSSTIGECDFTSLLEAGNISVMFCFLARMGLL